MTADKTAIRPFQRRLTARREDIDRPSFPGTSNRTIVDFEAFRSTIE